MVSMRAARADRNMSLDKMAKKIGVCKATLIKWEHCRTTPTPEQHFAYCEACGWNPSDVWYGSGFILSKPSTESKWKD